MRCCYLIWVAMFLGLLVSCSHEPLESRSIIDLTHPFDQDTIYWPHNLNFTRTETARGMTSKGYWYASGNFSASEHGGTHIDAPIHFAASGLSVDEIPVRQLIGPAIVIDIRQSCQTNPDYELSVADIVAWESQQGEIESASIILLWTGWGKHWPNKQQYLGSTTPNDPTTLHFPGFSAKAIGFLVYERHIRGVGIDTASIDPGKSTTFPAHRILSEANHYALENVANMEKLPPRGSLVAALPIKIKGGTGGPVRVVAFVP